MTYRELRDKLNELIEKDLDLDAIVFDSWHKEYFRISSLVIEDGAIEALNLDEGHPVIMG